jgi:hypothetical protein
MWPKPSNIARWTGNYGGNAFILDYQAQGSQQFPAAEATVYSDESPCGTQEEDLMNTWGKKYGRRNRSALYFSGASFLPFFSPELGFMSA